MKIAVAGTGYVGLSLAVLLSQHNEVTAVDVIEEKVNKINATFSTTKTTFISTKFISNNRKRKNAPLESIQPRHATTQQKKSNPTNRIFAPNAQNIFTPA